MFEIRLLLAVDHGAFGAKLKASNILNDGVLCLCGAFSGRLFRAEEIAGYYYGTVVYSNQMTQKLAQKTYGGDIMSVTEKYFSTWAFKDPETFSECMGKERSLWIVPTCYFCMQFINDSHYHPGVHGDLTSFATTREQSTICANVFS